MNSTDDVEMAARLGALFDTLLLPLAQRMQAEGIQAFPMAPDVSWLSYYVRRRRSSMGPADFDSAACAGLAELEARLAAHWLALGRTELAAQAGQFAAAARVPAADGADGAELSPYVYAMF